MSHGIEIIDPGDVGGFEPESPRSRDDFDRIPYNDIPEVRPPMHQRMSSLNIDDKKSNTKVRRDSALDRDGFSYWRLEKEGEDWGSAYRRKLMAPQNEIEKMAKKGKGSVLAETTRMGALRSQHLTRLVDDMNLDERSGEKWEPVYIKSAKVTRRTGKIECKTMDVILARRRPSPRPSKQYRSSSGGELVDIITESKPKGDRKDKKKDKDRSSSPKRDSFLDDPFSSQPLFNSNGKPMDDRGVIEFSNAGLPSDIPADRPIGYGAREERVREEKLDKGRRKSKDRDDDDFAAILDAGDFVDTPSAAVDSLDAILGRETLPDIPHAEPGRRSSHSSRRRKGTRSRSRSRPESISFPPSYHTRQYMGDHGDSSSTTSNESRYGIDREERSSYTSQDTYPSIGRRGSHLDPGRPKVYKEHYSGPSRSAPKYYHGEAKVYEEPARSNRRYSRDSFSQPDRIPETHQIGYKDYVGDVVRRPYDDPDPYRPRPRSRPAPTGLCGGPILHYPGEMPDRRAERYMNEAVRDEYLDQRERDIRERERRMDAVEQHEESLLRQERFRRERELDEAAAADARYQEELERREHDRRMRAGDERKYHDDRYWDARSGRGYYDRYDE